MDQASNPEAQQSSSSYSQIKQLIRQNSEKMGSIAEDVILPKNQRSVKKKPEAEVIDLEQMQTPTPTPYGQTTVVIVNGNPPQRKHQESKFPIFMLTISVLQVALYYSMDDTNLLLFFGYDPNRRHELWRYFTVMLAHVSALHLWGNVIFQLILGVLLEIVHHWKRIAIIYLASVFGGSLFMSVISSQSYGVGASAGVYGLLFAHLSTIILNWNEMNRKCCRLFWLLLYIVYDVGTSMYLELVEKKETNTSHAGHLGGAITGFLMSILVLRNFEKHPWEKKMQKICAGTLIGLFVIIVIINLSFPSLYPVAQFNFNYVETYLKLLFKTLNETEQGSEGRVACLKEPDCVKIFNQYLYNGTILSER